MHVVEVKTADKHIYLVGTAHVSKKSAQLVRETIDDVNPDVVAVELCQQRKHSLLEEKRWDETEITEVLKSGRIYMFLVQLLLANFQRKVGAKVGVKPGQEMIEALNIAKEKDIPIALVDRDIKITLKRAMSALSLSEKAKLFYGLFSGIFEEESINEEAIERLKDKDVLSEMMDELSREVPSIKRVLVDERNEYIAEKILALKQRKVVAVVGAGHIEGLTKALESSSRVDVNELETVAAGGKTLKRLAYIIPVIFILIVAWSLFRHSFSFTIDILFKWFMINGSLAALGVLLAMGHPLSALSAFLAAPITSLNPAIAAGWVAGFVELKIRKPRVKDFTGLLYLDGYRAYWGNRVTRLLLVVVFANIGSTIGTVIALPYIASLI